MRNIPPKVYIQVGEDPGDDFKELDTTHEFEMVFENDIVYYRDIKLGKFREVFNTRFVIPVELIDKFDELVADIRDDMDYGEARANDLIYDYSIYSIYSLDGFDIIL